jgi:hypothetical protein
VEDNDVAVLPREGPQHVQRIVLDLQRHADDGRTFRSGWSSATFDWHARAPFIQLKTDYPPLRPSALLDGGYRSIDTTT